MLQRFKCSACGRKYDSLTGSVFECSQKNLPTRVDFINPMKFGMYLEGTAANRGVSHPAAFK